MIEAMKQALEALEDVPYMSNKDDYERFEKAQAALRQAIEQAEKQEPVATVVSENEPVTMSWWHEPALPVGTKLYTTPQPQREQDEAYKAAAYLAKAIFDSLYANKEPYVSGKVVWELCDTTVGVITQIDNMVSQFSPRHPQPQREWVGLTDDELKPICDENHIMLGAYAVDFIRAIEAKLKEKNT